MRPVPESRVRQVNAEALRPDGAWVLAWVTHFRRTRSNFSLQHAVGWALRLQRPLVVLETLRCDERWANDRLHRFALQGMADSEAAFARAPVLYLPFVEPAPGEGWALLERLAARACVVVTDDAPLATVRHALEQAARLPVRVEAVDANGLLPLLSTSRVFNSARSFRVHLRNALGPHLAQRPLVDPLARLQLPRVGLERGLSRRWPRATPAQLRGEPAALAALPIRHDVPPVAVEGGARAARRRLGAFLKHGLAGYAARRDAPAEDGTSRLSMYLHAGHLSVHEVVAALEAQEGHPLAVQPRGRRHQMFGMSEAAEHFLEELVTWRELAYHWDAKHPAPYAFSSLPAWALRTLEAHRADARPALQSREALEQGDTHDALFNAAQRQLVREGWFHNAARMVWGKKLLEYSASPEAALALMTELMNTYSLDGRDPAGNAGFGWVLGRFDRPWGPERPIFGTVRYMSSTTPEKLRRFRDYIASQPPLS